MIHYQLRCGAEHGFDGWFRDSAAFEQQSKAGLVSCPECGDIKVNRALMAPAIGRKTVTVEPSGDPSPRAAPAPGPVSAPLSPPAATPAAVPSAEPTVAAGLPDQMRAVLQRFRAEIERTSDYVGPGFADEARRIHRGESEKRSIYGESTPEQTEALAEEGIEFARIPWVPRADG